MYLWAPVVSRPDWNTEKCVSARREKSGNHFRRCGSGQVRTDNHQVSDRPVSIII